MAFSTESIQEIYSNAKIVVDATHGTGLLIPSGDISTHFPSAINTGVAELVWGLVDTLSDAVATGAYSNLRSSVSQSLAGNTLTKSYSFTVNLDFSAGVDASVNVKDG